MAESVEVLLPHEAVDTADGFVGLGDLGVEVADAGR